MYSCDYVWDMCVYDSENFFIRLVDVSDVGYNKLMCMHYFVVYSLWIT